ncbi:MAG: NAD(P)-dependent oxidoreductase [Verrucomicrobiaceae bacterium]|nr:NAD(P)-dependent oxidoreductase [Verrucomicrobiaceae bacterium]
MSCILVTGATGFLGGAVARELHRCGLNVIATGRNREAGKKLKDQGIEFQPCDIGREPELLNQLISQCSAVVHAAALSAPWGNPHEFTITNQHGTEHVIKACRSAKSVKRLVHISSPSVQFDFKDQPLAKEMTTWTSAPANDYIATKRQAETMILEASRTGLDTIVLRPKALFGPGDTTLLPRVARVAMRGSFPLFGDSDSLMDLTFIDDAVNAVLLALDADSCHSGKVYNVTSGDPQRRSRVLGTLLEACGLPVRFRSLSIKHALALATALEWASCVLTRGRWEPPLTRYSVGALGYEQTLDISAARRDLGYAPPTDVLARLRETGCQWRKTQTRSNTFA